MRAQAFRLIARAAFLVGYVGAIVLVTRQAANGTASVGDVAMTAVLAGQILTLVTGSAELTQWLPRTLTAAARYLYLEQVAEPHSSGTGTAMVPARLTGGIRLEEVSYRYPGRSEPTLHGLTMDLPAGTTVAIVGENGAGKTTLVSLLAGLCRPTEGRILIDGTDLAALDPEAWRLRAMTPTRPLLLLLDEPTAAIDAETEHALFARWTHARQVRQRSGAITVLVSHRFSTVRTADLILVLRDGAICERGSHDELIRAGGLYAELFELQARAYR